MQTVPVAIYAPGHPFFSCRNNALQGVGALSLPPSSNSSMRAKQSSAFDPRWDGASIPERDWHFHRRLFERYGIVLLPGELRRSCTTWETGERC